MNGAAAAVRTLIGNTINVARFRAPVHECGLLAILWCWHACWKFLLDWRENSLNAMMVIGQPDSRDSARAINDSAGSGLGGGHSRIALRGGVSVFSTLRKARWRRRSRRFSCGTEGRSEAVVTSQCDQAWRSRPESSRKDRLTPQPRRQNDADGRANVASDHQKPAHHPFARAAAASLSWRASRASSDSPDGASNSGSQSPI